MQTYSNGHDLYVFFSGHQPSLKTIVITIACEWKFISTWKLHHGWIMSILKILLLLPLPLYLKMIFNIVLQITG